MTGDTLLTLKQVRARVGLGVTKIYGDMAQGKFPKPLKLGTKHVRWLQSEIDSYIEQQIAIGRAPTPAPDGKSKAKKSAPIKGKGKPGRSAGRHS